MSSDSASSAPTAAEPSKSSAAPAPALVAERIRVIRDVALNRHLGLELDHTAGGVSQAWFDVNARHIGVVTANAGVLYALMDSVAMLALVPLLPADRHAVTHDMHVSVIRPLPADARCHLVGEVLRVGRSIAFVNVTARVGDQVVATARVTKSLVPA